MKQKTVMQLMIDKLIRMPDNHIKNYLLITGSEYMEKEKEQMINVYTEGTYCDYVSGEEYYNETFKED